MSLMKSFTDLSLNLKAPRKTASENVVCLCRLLNILANSVDPEQTVCRNDF